MGYIEDLEICRGGKQNESTKDNKNMDASRWDRCSLPTGCGKETQTADFSGVTSVCELATLKCYYHNVAKAETEASGIFAKWLKTGYKKIWTEYSGIIEYGIDISQVTVSEPDKNGVVTVTMPDAQVLNVDVDEDSLGTPLTDTGFLTSVTTEEKTTTLAGAQEAMEQQAKENTEMLSQAKARAKTLIEEYIKNVGESIGEEYTVEWKDAEPGMTESEKK